MEIVAVTPTNTYDTYKMKYLLESCVKNNIIINIIGINEKFSWLKRMIWFQNYLKSLPYDLNQIVCFTDAYDVFYRDNLEVIKDKFLSFKKKIVWSSEKMYTHQLNCDKEFYENLAKRGGGYNFLNAGTFIGYKNELLRLFNDIIDGSLKDPVFINELKENIGIYDNDEINGLDQTWISHHLVKHWNKYDIALDYECSIFYVATGEDWHNIDNFIDDNLCLKFSGKKPSIIHAPYKSTFEYILVDLYSRFSSEGCKQYLINKTYSWEKDTITFLKNNKMNAFGNGHYTYIDDNMIKAYFGGKEHLIIFNKEYTKFTSVRKNDSEVIKGLLLFGL
jgi:hypothetical protein